jgi:hypothetical protein
VIFFIACFLQGKIRMLWGAGKGRKRRKDGKNEKLKIKNEE